MYQGTTPTIPITLKGADLTAARIFLTIQSGTVQLTLESGTDFEVTYDGENTVGQITLTQEQTLQMSRTFTVQARWVFPDGSAGASVKKTGDVNDVILKDVIAYVDE